MIWYGFALGAFTGAVIMWTVYAHRALTFLISDETMRMVAFAQRLRSTGYQGHSFSTEAVDHILALSTDYDHMVRLAGKAVELARAVK